MKIILNILFGNVKYQSWEMKITSLRLSSSAKTHDISVNIRDCNVYALFAHTVYSNGYEQNT